MQQAKQRATTPFGFHLGTDRSIMGTSLDDKAAARRMIGKMWGQGVSFILRTMRSDARQIVLAYPNITCPSLSESKHREKKGATMGVWVVGSKKQQQQWLTKKYIQKKQNRWKEQVWRCTGTSHGVIWDLWWLWGLWELYKCHWKRLWWSGVVSSWTCGCIEEFYQRFGDPRCPRSLACCTRAWWKRDERKKMNEKEKERKPVLIGNRNLSSICQLHTQKAKCERKHGPR